MSDENSGSDKSFDPTPRKLEQARKRGQVPISQDLLTASVFFGFIVSAAVFGLRSIENGGSALAAVIESSVASRALGRSASIPTDATLLTELATALAPLLLLPFLCVFASAIGQNAMVIAPDRIKPKLSRISPISIAKQKYGADGLFNFAKSFLKLIVYSAVLAFVANNRLDEILAAPAISFSDNLKLALSLATNFLVASLVVMVAIGMADFLWQRAQHMRRNRMTFKELQDENKETEGDPNTKNARRQKSRDIATNRMLAEVPRADVVVVNPTHFAVALHWTREPGSAPKCVAKGTDRIAQRIREIAIESAVPIQSDPATTRAIFASVDIGKEILPEHYRAVAAAIRFADEIRKRARR